LVEIIHQMLSCASCDLHGGSDNGNVNTVREVTLHGVCRCISAI